MENYLGVRVRGSCSMHPCARVAGRLRLLLPAWGILYPAAVGKPVWASWACLSRRFLIPLHNCWEESFQNRLWTTKGHGDKTLKGGRVCDGCILRDTMKVLNHLVPWNAKDFLSSAKLDGVILCCSSWILVLTDIQPIMRWKAQL